MHTPPSRILLRGDPVVEQKLSSRGLQNILFSFYVIFASDAVFRCLLPLSPGSKRPGTRQRTRASTTGASVLTTIPIVHIQTTPAAMKVQHFVSTAPSFRRSASHWPCRISRFRYFARIRLDNFRLPASLRRLTWWRVITQGFARDKAPGGGGVSVTLQLTTHGI